LITAFLISKILQLSQEYKYVLQPVLSRYTVQIHFF
jgi:hypothetical protein